MRIRRFLLVSACFLIACEKGPETTIAPAPLAAATVSATQRAGDLLFARSNCSACHAVDASITNRTGLLSAPRLDRIGARLSSAWIAQYLSSSPHIGATGMRMPNVLHELAADKQEQSVRDLTAYLSSLRGGPSPQPFEATRPSQIQAGEKLWRTIGCVACHPIAPDEMWVSNKWNAPELATFLKNPTTVWPDGQMPTTMLSDEEARSLTAWLLRGQGKNKDGSVALSKEPGVAVDYYEGSFDGVGPSESDTSTRSETMAEIGLPKFARPDKWGTRFHATLTIPIDGSWTFWIGSDDGSSLSIDGELLVESPGIHGTDWKKATRTLSAGPHEILVTYFEGAGNNDLEVQWVGPNQRRQRIPASAYTRETIPLRSPNLGEETPRSVEIENGRRLFAQLGCVNCHGAPADGGSNPLVAKAQTPLSNMNLRRGCLAGDHSADHPDYNFQPADIDALRTLLSSVQSPTSSLPATESLSLHLQALNCTGCHSRQDAGQPRADAMTIFAGTADLGEQGRVPPTLDGAGAKLRTTAIAEILAGSGRVRPYLLTRMPLFGQNSSALLPSLLEAADHPAHEAAQPVMTPEAIAAGTALAGVDGLACISCHGISGYPSLGVPAVDLSHTYGRLRHAWFDRYMRNPSAVYAGTRMPTFWQQGQHVHPDFLGGDPTKQIDALWTYLSLGSSMPLPKGIIAGGEYALMPQSRPIVLGTFMDGLSARCFAVGFPEQVHYVYDGDHRRTAKAWRGQFMDAAGTWFGRAGLLCKPAGIDVIDFPAGDPVAVLTNSQNPWPTRAGRDAGWRFLGSDRDSAGVPTFRTSDGALSIEERLAPAPAVGGAHLVRNFIIRAKTEPIGAMLRAWTSPSISSSDLLNGVTGWKAENGPTIFVTGGLAFVRTSAATNEQELLVPIGFQTGSDPERPYEAHIRLEYVW